MIDIHQWLAMEKLRRSVKKSFSCMLLRKERYFPLPSFTYSYCPRLSSTDKVNN